MLFFFCKTLIDGGIIMNKYVGGSKFIIVYDKFYFLLKSVGSMFLWINVFRLFLSYL